MATKSAGRVSIRVLPDSTGFKRDLEKSLDRIERQLKAKIPVELVLKREDLARLKRQIESLVIKIKPTIDLSVDQEDIEAMKAKIERAKPKVDVGLNTIIASRRIEALTRTRTVTIIPVIAKALGGFGKHLRGLAGLNVITNMFEEGIHFFQNIDTHAVSLAKMYSKISGIASTLGAAAGSALTLSSNLASIANLALFAPGFFTAFGIGVGVLITALKDLPFFLQDLRHHFIELHDVISTAFWKEAAQPIRDLTNNLMPTLKSQLKDTATLMGGLFKELADSIADEATPERVKGMFEQMNKAIKTARGAIRPFVRAFTTLGEHGSKYFDRFAKWVVKSSEQFDKFIDKAAKDGRLDRWMEDAIKNTKALGDSLRGIVRIFASLGRAAEAAGSINLTQLGESLNKAADVMNSERFQRVATTLFRGMNDAVTGIARGFMALGPAIESAAPSLERIFQSTGRIFETVGHLLALVIDNPKLQAGAEKFFQGIESGLKKLAPAMTPFADSLGGALKLLGRMFDGVMEVIAAITIELGPELDKIGDEFDKLIDPLKGAILKFVTEVKPVLVQFRTDVVAPLVKFINEQALPLFSKISDIALPAIKVILEEIKEFIDVDLTNAFKGLNSTLDNSEEKGKKLAEFLKGIMDGPTPGSNDFFKNLMPGFNGAWLTPDGIKNGNFWKDWENLLRPLDDWVTNTAVPWIEGAFMNMMKSVEDWINTDFKPWAKSVGDALWKAFLALLFGGSSDSPETDTESAKYGDLFWESVRLLIVTGYEKWKAGIGGWLKDINPINDLMEALFGDSARSTKGTGGFGGSGGAKGFGPSAKIGPELFNEEAEKGFLQKLIAGMGVTLGGAGVTIDAAFALWSANTKTQWDTYWEGFKTAPGGAVQTTTTTVATGTVAMGVSLGTFIATNAPVWASNWETMKQNVVVSLATQQQEASTKTAGMTASLVGFIAANAPTWASNWETMKQNVVLSLATQQQESSTKTAGMAASLLGFLATVTARWGPGWETFKGVVTTAWRIITGDTTTGVNNSANEAGQLPQKSKNAVDGAGINLLASGAALVASFASGMEGNVSLVTRAAAWIVGEAKKYFPFSPAKKGPLSGLGYTTHSGRALVKDFAGGMMENMSMVRDATNKVAGAVKLGANMDLTTDLGADGIVIDRREVNLTVNNPINEPTSRTIEKATNKLRMAKAI